MRKLPGALHQPRQPRKDRGRVALGRRRLSGGQADLARRHGKARQRIEHQQHVLALRGKDTRPPWSRPAPPACAAAATGRRSKPPPPSAPALPRPANRVKKLAHLAPALAHQAHHRHIGLGVARHHADQRALAHARSAEDAHALAAAHGQQRVDGANAGAQRLAIGTRSSGERTAPSSGSVIATVGRLPSVDRLAQRIQHPAHQRRPHLDLRPASPAPTPDRRSECPPWSPPASTAHSSREIRSPRPSARAPPGPRISQHSPTEASGPADSMVWPTDSRTCPRQRQGCPRSSRAK